MKHETLIFADDRPTSLNDDLYQWSMDAETVIRSLHTSLTDAQAEIARLRGALDEIGALCRHLRQGGPDPMDLESLSDALTTAVDTAHDALK